MNWNRVYSILRNNLGLKILALVVAVLLWLYVTTIEAERSKPVGRPLFFFHEPEEMK